MHAVGKDLVTENKNFLVDSRSFIVLEPHIYTGWLGIYIQVLVITQVMVYMEVKEQYK